MEEFIILIGNVLDSDVELFFGPIEDCDKIIKSEDISKQVMLKSLGLVVNTKQARDLNMMGEIPFGFTDYILNPNNKKRRKN